ncbi:unnamed protein product [Discula destructiva]
MPSFFHKAAAVLAICATTVSGHITLANPVPYSVDSITTSPLTSSQYPCQVSGDAASFYSTDGISNTATAGESISMTFKGSAVHGGGSCQIALSTDMQPSTSTRWSVILSIEGGCPTKDGSATGSYDVKIPSDIPAGTYSYAWTWTSKLSGTQEYYMNCAPITIKAASGSKKRSKSIRVRSDALDAYPPLAVYNLADLNSCKSVLSSDPKYPFPGTTVEHDLASGSYTYEAITGSDCFAKGVTYSGSSSDESSSSDSSSSDASSSAAPAASTVAAGGVFATASAAPAAATGTSSGPTGSSSGSSGSSSGSDTTSASGSTATGSASSSSGSTSGSTSSSSSSSSGSCTAGDYECATDGSSYKMCVAGGEWSASMSMASGTACTPGTTAGLTISATSSKKRRSFRLY